LDFQETPKDGLGKWLCSFWIFQFGHHSAGTEWETSLGHFKTTWAWDSPGGWLFYRKLDLPLRVLHSTCYTHHHASISLSIDV
jgi:hypothetical protein